MGPSADTEGLAWASIAICIGILIHSQYIHKFKTPLIRVLVDLCAVATLMGAIVELYLLAHYPNSQYDVAILEKLTLNCIVGIIVQIADNAVFLLGFMTINKKISKWMMTAIISAIVILLYLTWSLDYTFFPFFMNTSSGYFHKNVYLPAIYVYRYLICRLPSSPF